MLQLSSLAPRHRHSCHCCSRQQPAAHSSRLQQAAFPGTTRATTQGACGGNAVQPWSGWPILQQLQLQQCRGVAHKTGLFSCRARDPSATSGRGGAPVVPPHLNVRVVIKKQCTFRWHLPTLSLGQLVERRSKAGQVGSEKPTGAVEGNPSFQLSSAVDDPSIAQGTCSAPAGIEGLSSQAFRAFQNPSVEAGCTGMQCSSPQPCMVQENPCFQAGLDGGCCAFRLPPTLSAVLDPPYIHPLCRSLSGGSSQAAPCPPMKTASGAVLQQTSKGGPFHQLRNAAANMSAISAQLAAGQLTHDGTPSGLGRIAAHHTGSRTARGEMRTKEFQGGYWQTEGWLLQVGREQSAAAVSQGNQEEGSAGSLAFEERHCLPLLAAPLAAVEEQLAGLEALAAELTGGLASTGAAQVAV
jgi:hypothetical protein